MGPIDPNASLSFGEINIFEGVVYITHYGNWGAGVMEPCKKDYFIELTDIEPGALTHPYRASSSATPNTQHY